MLIAIIVTIATSIHDISNAVAIVIFAGLVSPRSRKLRLSYLKTEPRVAVSNFVTMPHARM
jgi:hypothetical protein